jgi:hypothetical protein
MSRAWCDHQQMRRTPLCLALLVFAGCGGGGSSADIAGVEGSARTEDKQVIAEWVGALRKGDLDRAAGYFALPSVVQNGTPPIRLTSRKDARTFNQSLPCGARLIKADAAERSITATFRLTDRPGGDCGPGAGSEARTRFVLRSGKIAVWERLADEPEIRGPVV